MRPLTPSLLLEAVTVRGKEITGPVLELMSSRGRLWLRCILSFPITVFGTVDMMGL